MNRNLFEVFNFKTHCRKQRSKTKPAENKISWGTDLTEAIAALNEEVSCRQIIHSIWQLLAVIYEHTNFIFHSFLAEKLCVKAGHQTTQRSIWTLALFCLLKDTKTRQKRGEKKFQYLYWKKTPKTITWVIKKQRGLKNIQLRGDFPCHSQWFFCFF